MNVTPCNGTVTACAKCGGLAFDFCVRYSAEDAQRESFDVVVIEDACRSIDMDRSEEATRHRFKSLGILCVLAANVRGRERAPA